MWWSEWVGTDLATVMGVAASACVTYLLIIVYVRVTGLRSLSKMTATDFAMTVAVGSLFATTIATPSPTLLTAAVAFGMLFLGQVVFAKLQRTPAGGLISNSPRLLVRDGELLRDAMEDCLVTEDDLRGKLREANAMTLSCVKAVVFESTGDVSVLHGDGEIDAWLMENVDGWDPTSRPADGP